MFDAALRRLIDPPLNRLGPALARRGASANGLTMAGLALGLVAALMIALGHTQAALLPLLASRVADGLDGAVARATGGGTDFGGFFDIVSDFTFYGAVPLAFVWLDPPSNGLAGSFLLASFYVNGSSFLGYAILAERHGMKTSLRGRKTLFFTGGLMEGGETIAFMVALCLFPEWFPTLAWAFGAACFATALSRVILAWREFKR